MGLCAVLLSRDWAFKGLGFGLMIRIHGGECGSEYVYDYVCISWVYRIAAAGSTIQRCSIK